MKRVFIITLFCFFVYSSFAQTIVWKQLSSLPEGYMSGEAVSLNNKIYFVAGMAAKTSNSFYVFNPKLNTWRKLADIPNPATNLAMVAVNGKIYAIGGDSFQNTNREYNPQTNTWKILEPMPTARQHIDCGVYGHDIYISGGLTTWKNISKKHEVYNTITNTWTEKDAIPSLRNAAAVVTLDNEIYVIGGAGTEENIWGDIWTVETYNINSDKWTQKNDLPILLFKPGAVIVNNEIIVLGGQTTINGEGECSDKVFIYKPKIDKWEETTPLPKKNVFFGCTSIDNKIYVIGGTPGGYPDWSRYTSVYVGEFIMDNSKDL